MKKEIEVEISSSCNLRCKFCNVGKRLHISSKLKRYDPDLVNKIIKYVPINSRLLFLGLGEPLVLSSQIKILKILNKRKDLRVLFKLMGL